MGRVAWNKFIRFDWFPVALWLFIDWSLVVHITGLHKCNYRPVAVRVSNKTDQIALDFHLE